MAKDTHFVVSVLALSCVLSSCALTPATDPDVGLAELQASQSRAYAVPAVGDTQFTVHAAFAAVLWAELDADQLTSWAHTWHGVRDAEDRPTVYYDVRDADGRVRRTNLFDKSPKDGFCVAQALSMHGTPHRNEQVRVALEDIERELRAR